MEMYKNLGGHSGVLAYEIGDDYIVVEFKKTLKKYTYSYGKAGKANVDTMKELAQRGYGLNSYIMHYVKLLYD